MAKQQITISLEPDVLDAVDSYRTQLPIPASRSRAVEALVRSALLKLNPQLDLGLSGGTVGSDVRRGTSG